MPRKDDQRTRMTKRMLQGALVDLLKEKPIQDVTVKELCQRAEVNRSTFYLHYYDIYALLEEMEGEIARELSATLLEQTFSADQSVFSALYQGIFGLFGRHAELCSVLLGEHGDKEFVSKLFVQAREKCVAEWMRLYPGASRERVEFLYVFISSGCVGLLRGWLSSGCREKPEEIAQRVEALVGRCMGVLE